MLVKVSVDNFKSFDAPVELTMISSSKIQGNKEHRVKIKQTQILKYGVVYGANASGKSTFLKTVAVNAIMAQTIHTCTASAYHAPCFQIATSMALRDNMGLHI